MFNFSNYPTIAKFHVEYEELVGLSYEYDEIESERPLTKEERDDYLKRDAALKKFEHEVYSKEIYYVFHNVKPVLRKTTGGSIMWDERYDRPFEELTNGDKDVLIGLIEEETVYRLPPEYYDEKSK